VEFLPPLYSNSPRFTFNEVGKELTPCRYWIAHIYN